MNIDPSKIGKLNPVSIPKQALAPIDDVEAAGGTDKADLSARSQEAAAILARIKAQPEVREERIAEASARAAQGEVASSDDVASKILGSIRREA